MKMCGDFTCSKHTLTALNLLYVIVSFILIGVAAYGIAENFITSLRIIGGIIACGVFLFLLSLLGLIGTIKHNQALLFFYMIILFLLFVVQFAIACACLAFNEEQQYQLAHEGWREASKSLRSETQIYFNCCEFEFKNVSEHDAMKGPSCQDAQCYKDNPDSCSPCWHNLQKVIENALKISGGIGLFFSFTEIITVLLAYRYRMQRNPYFNPIHLFI